MHGDTIAGQLELVHDTRICAGGRDVLTPQKNRQIQVWTKFWMLHVFITITTFFCLLLKT